MEESLPHLKNYKGTSGSTKMDDKRIEGITKTAR